MWVFLDEVAETPFTYLDIPLYHKRNSNKDWKVIEDRFERRLSTWKSKLLSYGGRLTFINTVLSNLSIYMLSFFLNQGYFGMEMDIRENIDSRNVVFSVGLETKVA